MSTEFERDLSTATEAIRTGRSSLCALVERLSEDGLSQGRRGHWTIAQVLEHVLQSDGYYVNLISDLRGRPRPESAPVDLSAVSTVLRELRASEDRILEAVVGVDEDTFYRMGGPAHQQYSVLSILENVAMHDHEHTAQIAEVAGTPRD